MRAEFIVQIDQGTQTIGTSFRPDRNDPSNFRVSRREYDEMLANARLPANARLIGVQVGDHFFPAGTSDQFYRLFRRGPLRPALRRRGPAFWQSLQSFLNRLI